MGKYVDDEVYPNQPLSDVACEVRFKGEMQVECQRHLFWDKIRDQYPDILVPQLQEGHAMALQHYKFRDPQRGRTVAVALNSIAFSEAKYSGHRIFIDEFDRLLTLFRGLYPRIGQITRVGWRYVNVMPFSREAGLVPVHRFLGLEISLPAQIFRSTVNVDLQWAGRCLGGDVIVRLATVMQKGLPEQEALLLDMDYGRAGPDIRWDAVKPVVQDARAKCRELFEDLITDNYRDYLRGKTL